MKCANCGKETGSGVVVGNKFYCLSCMSDKGAMIILKGGGNE